MSDIKFAHEADRASWFFRQLWWGLEKQVKARAGNYAVFPKPWEEINDLTGGWN